MPAPIVQGALNFMLQQLNVNVWDGEVPRFDLNGNPINPQATTSPSDWPVVTAKLLDQPVSRNYTFEDAYDDEGPLLIQIWGFRRDSTEPLMDQIEALFYNVTNWPLVAFTPAGGEGTNPYYVVSMLLTDWTSVQEEGVRLAGGQLCYRCDMHYQIDVHGALPAGNI